jgi:hypothetical protein
MFWFALVPGVALCTLVVGLFLCELARTASRFGEGEDVS